MKLLIDVSEEDYKECVFRKDLLSLGGEPTDLTFNMRIETLIANGTPLSEELEKIKEKVKQRKILPKTSARSDYEMGLIDGRSTEKVAIMGIIKKEIAELKGENNE